MKTSFLIRPALLACALIGPHAGWAGESSRVRTSALIVPSTARPGEEMELLLTLEIADGWHIYGRSDGPGGTKKLQLKLELPSSIQSVGEWTWPKPENEDGGVETYRGVQTFSHKLKVVAGSGAARVVVALSYQACTEEVCDSPAQDRAVASLTIGDASAAPSPRP